MDPFNIEEDMVPRNICGNCYAPSTRANPVRYVERVDRRLCRQCEPNPNPKPQMYRCHGHRKDGVRCSRSSARAYCWEHR